MSINVEVRKLQLIGGSSFMVSLPKSWIKKNRLDQGDEILLDIDENVIKILPKKYSENNKIVKAVVESLPKYDENFLRRFLIALYIQGLDEIIIKDNLISPKVVSRISRIVHDVIGVEVIDACEDKIVLRSLTTTEFDVEGVLKRMSQIVSGIIETIVDCIRIDDKEGLKDVSKLEEDADRLYLLAVRLENRVIKDMMSPSKWSELRSILGMRIIAKTLEEIADSLFDFSENLYRHPDYDQISKKFESILLNVEDMFNKAMDSYLSSNINRANEVLEMSNELEDEFLERMRERAEDPLLIYPFIDICRKIKSIGEISINRGVRELIVR